MNMFIYHKDRHRKIIEIKIYADSTFGTPTQLGIFSVLYRMSCLYDAYLGTVESNSQTAEAVCLTINFHKYNVSGPIYYPPFDKVMCFFKMFRFTFIYKS